MTKYENAYADRTAKYWEGPISRKEIQPIFDQYTEALNGLAETVAKLNVTISYLADKLGVTPEDFSAYLTAKQAEFQALQEAAKQAQTPVAQISAPICSQRTTST